MKLFKLFLLTTLVILIVFLSGCKTGGGDDIQIHTVIMNILDYSGNPLSDGTITTNMGVFNISTNTSVQVEVNNEASLDHDFYKAEINVPGYIKRITRAENKNYIMIPLSEDPFYSDKVIASPLIGGTHRFDGQIKMYIDGSESDPDYSHAKERFEVIAESLDFTFVADEGSANFIIRLNQDKTTHAENTTDGIINKTTVYLKDGTGVRFFDEEIAQGLCHVGNSVAKPTGWTSAIAGGGAGWNEPVDRLILNAFYNRTGSKFDNTGVEREIKYY